jgi:hypothetical protein
MAARTSTLALALLVAASTAHAEERPLGAALERFEFGDYEGVVTLLRPLVETGGGQLPDKVDRLEALRTYGIACMLTGRRTAAEGAFLLLLRAEPSTELDPRLVPPEAVSFFAEVRGRYRAELAAAYRKHRPRRYLVLNFLPPAGQFQNRQRAKGYALGAAEVLLLGTNILSGELLDHYQGPYHLFEGHQTAYSVLRPLNIASFATLLGVAVYSIVDGLVVGRRLRAEERREEGRMSARAPRIVLDGNFALRF